MDLGNLRFMKKFFVFVLSIFCLSGYSQQKLTLSYAVNYALKNNLGIQIAQGNLDVSVINNYIGFAGALPAINGTVSDNEQVTSINQQYADATKNTQRNNVGANSLAYGVTGSILLYNGKRVTATMQRLEELKNQNQQYLYAQIQNTMAGVMAKYYDIVRQQSYLKTIIQSIDVSKKKLDILVVRKDVGMSNNADVFQAQLDLNALIQSKLSQELVIEQAKTDLVNQIFMKPGSQISIADTIIVDKTLTIDSIQNNLSKNPLLNAANQQIHINQLIEKETAAQRYPTLKATTGYNFSSVSSAAGFTLLNQSYGPFIGINLSVPIYNGSIYKKQQQMANVNTKIARLQRDSLSVNFEYDMFKTYQAYKTNINQLKTEQDNYDLSVKLLDLVIQRFQVGQATIIDVKQAQQSFEDEGYRLVNLNYAAKMAEIELKRVATKL